MKTFLLQQNTKSHTYICVSAVLVLLFGTFFFGAFTQKAEAAISYVGATSGNGTSAAFNVSLTSLTGGAASAPAANDIVLVLSVNTEKLDTNAGVGTSGYTEVAEFYANDSYDTNFSISWKRMGTSPDTTVSCNGSTSTETSFCLVYVWRGVDTTTALDATTVTASGINAGIPNPPSITPVTSGAVVIVFGSSASNVADTSVTAPSGYSNHYQTTATANADITAAAASKAWTSGAEDPAVWTGWNTTTSDSWGAATLALRPAKSLSGVVYLDDGVTTAAPGLGVRVAVSTTTSPVTYSTVTTTGGAWDIVLYNTTGMAASTPVAVWVAGNPDLEANLATRMSSTISASGLNLYKDKVIIRHEDSGPVTLANLDSHDEMDEVDMLFTASSSAGTLEFEDGASLYVWSGDTFSGAATSTTYGGGITNNGTITTHGATATFAGTGGTLDGTGTFEFTDIIASSSSFVNDGVTWDTYLAPEANSWFSVTYGEGLFVAISWNGTNRVMTSPDGITWTGRTAAEANAWSSVTYGNGLFVAVSSGGTNRVMTSPDGITWTARSAAEANAWRSVTYGEGLFVAVADSGTNRVMTSPDGITWTARSAAAANVWQNVTYGNGLFVAVACGVSATTCNGTAGGSRVMTSPDGTTWTGRTAASAGNWQSVTYGEGLFVAIAATTTTTNSVMTSPDGTTWTGRTASEANNWESVVYGDGIFVVVSTTGTNRAMTSPDGITWTARAATNALIGLTFANDLFVAVGNGGTNRVSISSSGSYATSTLTFSANASTTDLTIDDGTTVEAPSSLTIYGDYSNNGTFTAGSGTVYEDTGATSDGWHLESASFDSVSTTTTETTPWGMDFSDDGMKLYILGYTSDNIREYTLTTAFDITTMTLAHTYSVAAFDTWSNAVAVSSDGTKIFVSSDSSDVVGEYSLSTPYDVSTATYVDALTVSAKETAPVGMTFSADGTKLYVAGNSSDSIHQYTLGTAWDVSTGSFLQSFSMATEDTTVMGIRFRPDGTAFYMVGTAGDDINEYSLSTPWDISTASYVQNFSVTGQDFSPTQVEFDTDGTKMFVVGDDGNDISRYTIGTAGSGVVDTDKIFSGNMTGDSAFNHIQFLGQSTTTFSSNASTTDFTIGSTATVTAPTLLTIGGDFTNNGVFEHNSGTVYVSSSSAQTLSGTMTGSDAFNNLTFLGSGTKTFSSNASTTDLTISAGTVVAPTSFTIGDDYTNNGTFTHNNGTVYFTGSVAQTLSGEMASTSAFNDIVFSGVSAKTFSDNATTSDFTIASGATVAAPSALTITGNYTNNGTFTKGSGVVYIEGTSTATTTVVTDAYDVTTAAYESVFSIAGQELTSTGLELSTDGTKLYAIGYDGDDVNQYALSTAWDITTASVSGAPFSFAGQDNFGEDIAFKSDGTKMYILGSGNDRVYSYSLSSAWDVTTASYDSVSFLVSGQDASPFDMAFKSDGTKMYIMGNGNTRVYSYSLSSAWDLSTASYDSASFLVSGQETNPEALTFNDDGTRMYVVGGVGVDINQYALSSAWDVTSASASGTPFSVSNQESYPAGIVFNTTGSQVFIVGSGGDEVNAYTVGTSSVATTTATTTLSGNLTGTSALNDLFLDASAVVFSNNASTTDLTITASTTVTAPTRLSIAGNYTNNGSIEFGTGTTTFNGTTVQTATGTMTGTNAFYNLQVLNTTATTSFETALTVDNRLTATSGVIVEFPAGATTTVASFSVVGTSGNEIVLRSTQQGTQWGLDATAHNVYFVDVKDSTACTPGADITATSSLDSGNNTCWTVVAPVGGTAALSSAANQTFTIGQATTSIATITITEDASNPSITAANDIRIAIATSTTNMRFDTNDTTAVFGGTASAKVANPVSYEGGGSVLVIPVSNNFAAGETLTISGLSFAQFGTLRTATSAIEIRTDGAGDSVANDVDDKTITITGSLVAGDHDAGQVESAFTYQNQTAVELFAFKLTPAHESSTVGTLTFNLTGVRRIDSENLTNIALYRDVNADGIVDAGDTAIGGSGVLAITGQAGSITFSSSWSATTSQNYLVIADITNVKTNEYMTMSLDVSGAVTGATSQGSITPTGSVSSVQHIRGGGLGSAGGSGAIGGEAPSGDGIVSGGDQGGGDDIDSNSGDTIGNEPGFEPSTANGTAHNEWTSGGNAYDSDGAYATAASANLRQSYSVFGFNVPGGNTVNGIEVKLEASGSTGAGTIEVALSWNGDSSVTATKATTVLTAIDAVYTLGGPADTWGRSWTPAEFGDANFFVRVIAQPEGNTVKVDALQVKPYHAATGGGGGGGGEI